jgi:hypothetical protein
VLSRIATVGSFRVGGVITPTISAVVRNGETVTLVPWEYTVLSDASIRYVRSEGFRYRYGYKWSMGRMHCGCLNWMGSQTGIPLRGT